MRVVAGVYKGRQLDAPAGMATRPTTARIRESWASSVTSASGGFAEAYVLDAFAGSGALGIEALSRGASHVVFADKDAKAVCAVKSNLKTLNAVNSAAVLRVDVLTPGTLQLLKAFNPFSHVFLDPPYVISSALIAGFLLKLGECAALAPHCLISYEQDKTAKKIELDASFEIMSIKEFATTKITYIGYKSRSKK